MTQQDQLSQRDDKFVIMKMGYVQNIMPSPSWLGSLSTESELETGASGAGTKVGFTCLVVFGGALWGAAGGGEKLPALSLRCIT